MNDMQWLIDASNKQKADTEAAQRKIASTPPPTSMLRGLGTNQVPSPSHGFVSPLAEQMFKGITDYQQSHPVNVPFAPGTKTLAAKEADISNAFRDKQTAFENNLNQNKFEFDKAITQKKFDTDNAQWNADHRLAVARENRVSSGGGSSSDGVPSSVSERAAYYTSNMYDAAVGLKDKGHKFLDVLNWVLSPQQQSAAIAHKVDMNAVLNGVFHAFTNRSVDQYIAEHPDDIVSKMAGRNIYQAQKSYGTLEDGY